MMGKGFKSLVTLGVLGGAAFGGFKAYEQYGYIKESYNNVIMFKGEKLIYDEVFEGDSVAVVASGVEIDLREADFDADYTNLDLYGVGAGFKVLVPEDVNVTATGINKGSGIQINVDDSLDGKILNITYDLTGSGLMVATHASCEAPGCCTDEASEDMEEVTEEVIDETVEESVLESEEEAEDELMAQIDELEVEEDTTDNNGY